MSTIGNVTSRHSARADELRTAGREARRWLQGSPAGALPGLVALVLLFGCGPEQEQGEERVPDSAAVVSAAECLPLDPSAVLAAPTKRIDLSAALWTVREEEYPLHRIRQAEFTPGGDVLVLDDWGRALHAFDGRSGALITRVGGPGRGPGEYLQTYRFNVFSDGRVALVDPQNRKITVFSSDFESSESLRLPEPSVVGRSSAFGFNVRGLTEGGAFVVTLQGADSTSRRPSGVVVTRRLDQFLRIGAGEGVDTIGAVTVATVAGDGRRSNLPTLRPSVIPEVSARNVVWLGDDGRSVYMLEESGSLGCLRWRGELPDAEAGARATDAVFERLQAPEVEVADRAFHQVLDREGLDPHWLPFARFIRVAPNGDLLLFLGAPLEGSPPGVQQEVLQVAADGTVLRRLHLMEGPRTQATVHAGDGDRLIVAWHDGSGREFLGVFDVSVEVPRDREQL